MRFGFIVIIASALACATQARAEIVSAGPNGFNLRHIAEAPNAARRSCGPRWPTSPSGGIRSTPIPATRAISRSSRYVRGCFCEKLSLYAGIEHATSLCAAGKDAATQRRSRAAAGIRRERRDDLEHRGCRRRFADHVDLQRRRLRRPAARRLGADHRRHAGRPAASGWPAMSPQGNPAEPKAGTPNSVRVPGKDASRSSHTCVFAAFSSPPSRCSQPPARPCRPRNPARSAWIASRHAGVSEQGTEGRRSGVRPGS